MAINEGDFIKINFTGKIKSTDEIYDTTIEELAQEAGVYNNNKVYAPSMFIVGAHQTFNEIEDAVIGCEVGDKKTVEVPCENAFGERNPKLIKTMHVKEFKKQGLNPYPGLIFQSEGSTGKVLTVNGGRVKVDFNNELSGKDLLCEVEICDIVEDTNERIKGLIQLRYAMPNVNIDNTKINIVDDVVNITLDPISRYDQQSYMQITLLRFEIARDIYENIDGINQVNFVDEFSKSEDKSESSEEAESEE